jgi:hypothetical protein
VVSFTFDDRDPASIIEDFISETSFLVCDKLPGDSVHGERDVEINKGSGDKVVGTRSHTLGTS